jgi:hypothetical protein
LEFRRYLLLNSKGARILNVFIKRENKSKRGLRKAPISDPKPIEHAMMHELDISALVPEPQGSGGEASEESGGNIKDPDNSPAITHGSTSLEPLAGESFGDGPGAAEVAPRHLGLNG